MSARLSLSIEFPHTVSRFRASSNTGSAISSAHRATAEAATPVVSFQLPCSTAIWMAKLPKVVRSEEHTSELQSQSNLVCRLLLEKKKKTSRPRQQHAPL